MLRLITTVSSLLVTALTVVSAPEAQDLKEWVVPWEKTRPRDPFVDAKNRVWFVGQGGNYVAYLAPTTGEFERYEIDAGTHPHNLVVDRNGLIWFTGNRNGRLVQLDPTNRKLTTYKLPDQSIHDPHTMVFDSSGIIWFTAQQAGVVGRFDPTSGTFRTWSTGENSRPYGIIIDGRGRPWFDLFGTNALGTIDLKTMKLQQYPLPHSDARPRRIGSTADGGIWYTDYVRGTVGRLNPADGKVTEITLPAGRAALPYAMTVDDQNRVWVAETGTRPNRLVALDAKTHRLVDSISVGGGDAPNAIRHMIFHKPTREIWFGTDRNTVGRLRVPERTR